MKIGTSYYSSRAPKHVRVDMQDLRRRGFTDVLHTFSEVDLKFNRGTMKQIARISHDEGLLVTFGAWALGGIFGGEAFSEFVPNHPSVWQVDQNGVSVPSACPNHTEFRDFVKTWIDAAAECGGDYVFWDEPHWHCFDGIPGEIGDRWTCHCAVCQELYRQQFGTELPKQADGTVLRFRENGIYNFLVEMTAYAQKQGLRNAVCLLPNFKELCLTPLWDQVAALQTVDVIGTDPYWALFDLDPVDFVGFYARAVQQLALRHHKEGQIWIQNWRISKQQESEIPLAVRVAYQAGIRNLFAWAYEGCVHTSSIACERPEMAFDAFVQACQASSHPCPAM